MRNEFQEILAAINRSKESFSQTEEVIANFFSNYPDEIPNLTLGEISEKCFVSKASISRFTRKIGYDNYAELKLKMKTVKEESESVSNFQTNDIFNRLFEMYTTIIKRHQLLLNESQVKETVNLILNAKNIYILGLGNSDYIASDFSLRLTRYGFKSTSITKAHSMYMQSKVAINGDLFIAISASGKTTEILRVLRETNKNNIPSILITNFEYSPCSECSNVTLLFPTKDDLPMSSEISNLLAPQFIVDVILNYLIQINPDKYLKIYEKTVVDFR